MISKTQLLFSLYSTGKHTHNEVARLAGVTYNSAQVFYHRHKAELPKAPRKMQDGGFPLEEAKNLYLSGKTLREVAAHFGVSFQAIHHRLKYHNIPIRRPGQPAGAKK